MSFLYNKIPTPKVFTNSKQMFQQREKELRTYHRNKSKDCAIFICYKNLEITYMIHTLRFFNSNYFLLCFPIILRHYLLPTILTIFFAISSGERTKSIHPLAMALSGISGCLAVSGFCANVIPPASLILHIASAPSPS